MQAVGGVRPGAGAGVGAGGAGFSTAGALCGERAGAGGRHCGVGRQQRPGQTSGGIVPGRRGAQNSYQRGWGRGAKPAVADPQRVPAAVIEVEPNSRSTQENAMFSAPLLRGGVFDGTGAANLRQDAAVTGKQDAYLHKRVILVTSWYHSRRALQCFRHYVPGIQFYSRPSYYAYARADWTREGIRPYIRAEYLKLVGYWVRYGVGPI